MFDVCEQYWTLLIAAVIAWRILDAILSERRSWWQWLLLILLLAASYCLDHFIETGRLEISSAITIAARVATIAAVVLLLILPVVQALSLHEPRWWLWLFPPCLAVAAFALDGFVKTDLEKINDLIRTGIKAVEDEKPDTIDTIVAPNYSDSYHNTKERLMHYCRRMLSEPLVEKNKKLALETEISPPEAIATLTVITKFDKRSFVYDYKPRMLIKTELTLQKQSDKIWLINRAELLEIDRQPVNWRQIK